MGLPVVVGAVKSSGFVKRALKKPSPRFHGGPLFGTVNDFLGRVARGDMAALQTLERLRRDPKEKHRAAWAEVWRTLVPNQPLTKDQVEFIRQADPSLAAGLRAVGPGVPVEATPDASGSPKSAFDTVLDPLREGAAESIQTVAAGIGTLGARAVAPADSAAAGAVNIPTDVKTLRNIAIGAAGVVVLVVLIVRFGR